MAKMVRVVSSDGRITRRKMSWVRKHVEAENGEWVDGVFHFYLQPQQQAAPRPLREIRATQPLSLLDLLRRAQDRRQFPCDPSYWDGRAVLRWWPDQGYHAVIVKAGE